MDEGFQDFIFMEQSYYKAKKVLPFWEKPFQYRLLIYIKSNPRKYKTYNTYMPLLVYLMRIDS